jgi:hypothetical protein
MAIPGLDNLSVLRLSRIVKKIQDARDSGVVQYRHRTRLNRVPTVRNELMARFFGRVLIADLIALDSAAGVYSSGKMDFVSSDAPKIKIGRALTESQLDQFEQIRSGNVRDEAGIMEFIGPIADNAMEGVAQRMEALYVGMLRDRLDYDRLGFKAAGALWGMPSDLRVTPSVPWTSTSATPVDTILALLRLARIRYGVEFNRLEMSTQAFQYAIATTEFQNKAKTFIRSGITLSDNISIYDTTTQKRLFEQTLGGASDGAVGVMIELNDDRYWYQNADGTLASARFQPINEVYLTNSRWDRNNAAADIGTIPVMETLLMGLNPGAVIGANSMGGAQRGPISYMTFPPDLNPPQVTLWAADVAFPRKHMPQYNAMLNVGAFDDAIPVTEPVF